MIKIYQGLRAFLGRCYSWLTSQFVSHESRLRNIEKFHVLVSEGLNNCLEQVEKNEKLLVRLQKFTRFTDQAYNLQVSLDQLPEVDYVKFENTFRGDASLIKTRQEPYLHYFSTCQNVVDIGCGRGEFLELARDHQIKASGIDLDQNMVAFCQQRGLKVQCLDMFQFLLNSLDGTFDGIFSAQVIEHVDFYHLQRLLYLLSKKLAPQGKIVLETVNPLCPVAHQHFYMDLTHIKPLFPDVVRFLAESFGLKKHALLFRTPVVADLPDIQTDLTQAHLYGDYALILEK